MAYTAVMNVNKHCMSEAAIAGGLTRLSPVALVAGPRSVEIPCIPYVLGCFRPRSRFHHVRSTIRMWSSIGLWRRSVKSGELSCSLMCCVSLYCVALRCVVSCHILLVSFVCVVLYRVLSCRAKRCRVLLCCALVRFVVLRSVVPCHDV